jgi:para-aminobenzoate synthetase component 1
MSEGKLVFRTAGGDNAFWRQLSASDPVDTIIITDIREIEELRSFLNKYKDHLCAGYFSYDLGLALQGVNSQHKAYTPLAVFHAYPEWTEDYPDQSQTVDRGNPALKFTPSVMQTEYRQNIEKIHDYIRAGDFYQINYTQQLHAESDLPGPDLFSTLIQKHPAAYGCYFEDGNRAIHSLSPELFLHFDNGLFTTEPIKGTRPRGDSETVDELMKQNLLKSEKEQAELFMITDLLRNDLGKVCEIGSVHLDAKKELKKLPKVWHTSSRISGKLLSGLSPLDAVLSMFPGGSISGCPKKRALEVIDELEISSRGIYTGNIGYFHPNGDFSFNIAIRTLVQLGTNLTLGTGGGITIDSKWEDEWNELLVKASTFQ